MHATERFHERVPLEGLRKKLPHSRAHRFAEKPGVTGPVNGDDLNSVRFRLEKFHEFMCLFDRLEAQEDALWRMCPHDADQIDCVGVPVQRPLH